MDTSTDYLVLLKPVQDEGNNTMVCGVLLSMTRRNNYSPLAMKVDVYKMARVSFPAKKHCKRYHIMGT